MPRVERPSAARSSTTLPASKGVISVKLDQRSYDRAIKRLEKYEGRPFKARMEAAYRAGLGLAGAPMRRVAPVKSGLLARKISTKKGRPDPGYIVRYGTKSRAPHAGLVSKGHRIVTPGGRDTGMRSRANPFVEQTIAAHEGRITRFITEATLSEGVGIRSF